MHYMRLGLTVIKLSNTISMLVPLPKSVQSEQNIVFIQCSDWLDVFFPSTSSNYAQTFYYQNIIVYTSILPRVILLRDIDCFILLNKGNNKITELRMTHISFKIYLNLFTFHE